jgi:hypothetical protein
MLAAVVAIGYGGWYLSRLAPIGSAYAAKMLCSWVFVSGREPVSVVAEDILADNPRLLRLVRTQVDFSARRTAATLGSPAAAQFRRAWVHAGDGAVHLAGSECPRRVGESPIPSACHPPTPTSMRSTPPTGPSKPDPQRLRRTRAVVVAHGGQIVAERYAPGFSADSPMPGWSMTKSAAGALAGILVQDGHVSLSAHALLDEWRGPGDGRADITVEQLLRMTDGLKFDERYDDPLSDVTHAARHRRCLRLCVAQTPRSGPGHDVALRQWHDQRARSRAAPVPAR